MIYLLGASHLMALLDACGADEPSATEHGFGHGRAPAFRDWPLRPGLLPDRLKVASIHLSHTAPFWGPTLVELVPPRQLGIAQGLQRLLAVASKDEAAQALFIAPRGEEYFHLTLAGIDDPYDFVLPDRPDLPLMPDCAPLPLAVVQAQLGHQLATTLLTLTAIRRLCPQLRVVRLPAPPPTSSGDVALWRAEQGRPEHPTERLPSSVRLKTWLLYSRMLAEGSAGLGIEILPVPAAALHADGQLRREYMEDPIHGNARYGALVIAQMAQALAGTLAHLQEATG